MPDGIILSDNQRGRSHFVLSLTWGIRWMRHSLGFADSIFSEESRKLGVAALPGRNKIAIKLFLRLDGQMFC
jgi:hypothetical protein